MFLVCISVCKIIIPCVTELYFAYMSFAKKYMEIEAPVWVNEFYRFNIIE